MAGEGFRWWRVVCCKPNWAFTVEMDVYAVTEQIAMNTLQAYFTGAMRLYEDFRPYMRAHETEAPARH